MKPAALATMTTTGALAGRPYVSMPSTGIPHAYQADFGATPVAPPTWRRCGPTGCRRRPRSPSPPPPVRPTRSPSPREYGATTTVQAASGTTYSLPLSDQVSYLTYPVGDTLTVGPTEAYGTDVASSAAGASATASSGTASSAIDG